ncbi:flagellar brake domain-containing protein [Paenibacillus aurantius]|uniref:Flagellar brake domain-containing protein n=1 Tax=Paenibacillus aurantius TaxID=2918900 RepID=A0AA96LA15_9BACL|nr:flagellar brake domain-containing protein [Paenibacillus aurantius]
MLPSINQLLYLQINSIDDEEAKQEYKSRIADIETNYLSVEIPIHEATGRLKRLYVGDELSAYFITEGGVKHYFTTSVLGFKEEGIRQVIIKKPAEDDISKIQRRNFLRVPAELEMAVQFGERGRTVAVTEDVGGGGISFHCDKHSPLSVGMQIACWLLVPYKNGKIDHIAFKGDVVRVKPLDNRQLGMLRFSEIADRDRQKIIRYCFERQLDFRKN